MQNHFAAARGILRRTPRLRKFALALRRVLEDVPGPKIYIVKKS